MFDYSLDDVELTRDGKLYLVRVEYNYDYGEAPSWTCGGVGECIAEWKVTFYGVDITSTLTYEEDCQIAEQVYGRH